MNEISYNKQGNSLFLLIGELFVDNRRLENKINSLMATIGEAQRQLANAESKGEDVYQKYNILLQKYEVIESDLKKALSLADLSQQGADTPNPFPSK